MVLPRAPGRKVLIAHLAFKQGMPPSHAPGP
jgi:hypothetical protein